MTYKELYNICHDEAVAYANSEQWSKRTGDQKSFLIQGYLDAMMEMRKSEITEQKKEYPKTYEECCKILGLLDVDLCFNADYSSFDASKEQWKKLGLMNQFYQLLICRDAYWKIAGEEMVLGKPWEPDWYGGSLYLFYYNPQRDEFVKIKYSQGGSANAIFVFPTEEMRDAYKENFGPDIEKCKLLL